jgi:hypothetical protein
MQEVDQRGRATRSLRPALRRRQREAMAAPVLMQDEDEVVHMLEGRERIVLTQRLLCDVERVHEALLEVTFEA